MAVDRAIILAELRCVSLQFGDGSVGQARVDRAITYIENEDRFMEADKLAARPPVRFTPLFDRLLVRPIQEDDRTASGLLIVPDVNKPRPRRGLVVAIGPGTKERQTQLRVGDRVVYGKYSGGDLALNGEDLLIMREDEVLGTESSDFALDLTAFEIVAGKGAPLPIAEVNRKLDEQYVAATAGPGRGILQEPIARSEDEPCGLKCATDQEYVVDTCSLKRGHGGPCRAAVAG